MCQNKICLIYQYLLSNGDRLRLNKKISLDRLKRSKDISADDLLEIHSAIIECDVFDSIAEDLFNLLNY